MPKQFPPSLVAFCSLVVGTVLVGPALAGQDLTKRTVTPSSGSVLPTGINIGAPQLPIHEKFATFRAGDFKSVLLVQNFRLDVPVEVTPALIVSTGEVPMSPVTVPPHSSTTVDINAFLEAKGISDTSGTAVMRYTFSPYAAVSGIVLSSDDAHHLYVNSYLQSPEEYWQGTSYDATLWAPDGDTKGSISIINTSLDQRTVQLAFVVDGKIETQLPVVVPARQTQTINVDDLVARSREKGAGIHVEYSEYPGSILVEGHLTNSRTGFEKYIHFLDKTLHYPNGTVRTQFLLLGQQPPEDGFPAGMSFRSVAVVRNIDPVPVQVTPTLKYQRNGSPESVVLQPLTLGVGHSRVIDLSVEQRAGRVPADFQQGSLKLDPNTDHASIVAELFNFDDKTGGFPIGPMFFAYPNRGTQSIWRTDGSFQTTIMVENTASQDDSLTLQLFSDQGTYSKTFPIPAGNLLKINLKELQQENTPDDHGQALTSTYGSLSITGSNGLNSKLSFDKLIHSADDSDYVGLPGGPGTCTGPQSLFLFLVGSNNPYQVWEETDYADGSVGDNQAWGTSSGNTSLMQISNNGSGDMATLTPIDASSHEVLFTGPPVLVVDCPACSVDDFTPQGQTTVPAISATLTLSTSSFITRVAGGTAQFTANVSVGTVSSTSLPITFTVTRGAPSNPSNVSLDQGAAPASGNCSISMSAGTCSVTFDISSSASNTNSGTVTWTFTGSSSSATVTPNPNPLKGTVQFTP